MSSRKTISKVNTQNSSNKKITNATPSPAAFAPITNTPVNVAVAVPMDQRNNQPALLPTPTLPNGEPVPPGVVVDLDAEVSRDSNQVNHPPSNWLETNHIFLYNESHLYGTYRIHLKEFIDWCNAGRVGNCFQGEKDCDLKVYCYKADPIKKFVTVNVRANDTFRMVKMFEPMSSNFLTCLLDQSIAVYQNLVNMLDAEQIHRSVVLPLSVVGMMKDDLYDGKRTTYIVPKAFSTQIKNTTDAVYRYTVLAFIDFKVGELSQLNQH